MSHLSGALRARLPSHCQVGLLRVLFKHSCFTLLPLIGSLFFSHGIIPWYRWTTKYAGDPGTCFKWIGRYLLNYPQNVQSLYNHRVINASMWSCSTLLPAPPTVLTRKHPSTLLACRPPDAMQTWHWDSLYVVLRLVTPHLWGLNSLLT